VQEVADVGPVGWAIRMDRRSAGKWLKQVAAERVDRVEVVAIDTQSLSAVRKAKSSLPPDVRRRIGVHTLASVLRKTNIDDGKEQ
jgi:hypothetical protein